MRGRRRVCADSARKSKRGRNITRPSDASRASPANATRQTVHRGRRWTVATRMRGRGEGSPCRPRECLSREQTRKKNGGLALRVLFASCDVSWWVRRAWSRRPVGGAAGQQQLALCGKEAKSRRGVGPRARWRRRDAFVLAAVGRAESHLAAAAGNPALSVSLFLSHRQSLSLMSSALARRLRLLQARLVLLLLGVLLPLPPPLPPPPPPSRTAAAAGGAASTPTRSLSSAHPPPPPATTATQTCAWRPQWLLTLQPLTPTPTQRQDHHHHHPSPPQPQPHPSARRRRATRASPSVPHATPQAGAPGAQHLATPLQARALPPRGGTRALAPFGARRRGG